MAILFNQGNFSVKGDLIFNLFRYQVPLNVVSSFQPTLRKQSTLLSLFSPDLLYRSALWELVTATSFAPPDASLGA